MNYLNDEQRENGILEKINHLLSPKPWEMTPEEERKSRHLSLFSGPFTRFGKDYLNDLTMVYGS